MPIIDIIIAVAIAISVVIGVIRGFVKEAISIAALLVAIWTALYFGPAVGTVSEEWLRSEELQWSALSGVDRFMGSMFGAARGILLVAVALIGAQFAGFDNDDWWTQSRLIPHLEAVADWIKVMAPEGFDMIVPDGEADSLPGESPVEV